MSPNTESRAASAHSANYFPADTLARIAAKPYMRPAPRHSAQSINVLTLGLGDRVTRVFSACMLVGDTRTPNARRRLFRCGDVSVEDLSEFPAPHALDREALEEEIGIIVRGERTRFGDAMRPSGWFSSGVLGRRYAREWPSAASQVHATIAADDRTYAQPQLALLPIVTRESGATPEDETSMVIRTISEPQEAWEVSQAVEDMLVARHVNARYAEIAEEARHKGRAEIRPAVVVVEKEAPPTSDAETQALRSTLIGTQRRASECETMLRDVMSKMKTAEDEKKKAVSTAFESGVRHAKDVVG